MDMEDNAGMYEHASIEYTPHHHHRCGRERKKGSNVCMS